jgi:hypothetical protein
MAVFVHITCALAAQGPPDPRTGESYDGRSHGPSWRDDLLLVPRLVLTYPRLLLRTFSYPLLWLLDLEERHQLLARAVSFLTSDDGQIGIRPALEYTLGFRPAGGVRFFDNKLFGPHTRFNLGVAGGSSLVAFDVHARPTPGDRPLQVDIDASYIQRDDQLFAGVGPASTGGAEPVPQARSRYAVRRFDLIADLSWRSRPGLELVGQVRYGIRRYGNGDRDFQNPPINEVYCLRGTTGQCIPGTVNPTLVPGFFTGAQPLGLGLTLRVDTRDLPGRPSSGGLFNLRIAYAHGLGADHSQYFRLAASASLVLDLWRRDHLLLIGVAADALAPIGDAPVPFTELVTLGGPDDLRGFLRGQFRDLSSILTSIEYRFTVWIWMDASLFADYGGVFGRGFADFRPDRLVPDVGFGIRIRTGHQVYLRLQTAYGFHEGWQLIFSANTP